MKTYVMAHLHMKLYIKNIKKGDIFFVSMVSIPDIADIVMISRASSKQIYTVID